MIQIELATNNESLLACLPVLTHLREGLGEQELLEKYQRFASYGFQLVALSDEGDVRCVAGFRFGENFAWNKYLYVDDLVTHADYRSRGYGEQLLKWLVDYAREHQCRQIHLDSALFRHEAHKFYRNFGFDQAGYHFQMSVLET